MGVGGNYYRVGNYYHVEITGITLRDGLTLLYVIDSIEVFNWYGDCNYICMNQTVLHFIETHAADDILWALSHPQYFGLTTDDKLELHAWVFQQINYAKEIMDSTK